MVYQDSRAGAGGVVAFVGRFEGFPGRWVRKTVFIAEIHGGREAGRSRKTLYSNKTRKRGALRVRLFFLLRGSPWCFVSSVIGSCLGWVSPCPRLPPTHLDFNSLSPVGSRRRSVCRAPAEMEGGWAILPPSARRTRGRKRMACGLQWQAAQIALAINNRRDKSHFFHAVSGRR